LLTTARHLAAEGGNLVMFVASMENVRLFKASRRDR